MRSSIIIILVLCWGKILPQDKYSKTLSSRLTELKKMPFYDNKIVAGIDSVEYHDMAFPYWNPNDIYYEDDVARYRYCSYVALRETKGERPDTSRSVWRLMSGPHPYLFLRDTAKLVDLRRLLRSKHPYVKTYAFGALSFRKERGLFSTIVDNLNDTTLIFSWWSDSGGDVYPADHMIEYYVFHLSESEKKTLEGLIRQKYPHLTRGLDALIQK